MVLMILLGCGGRSTPPSPPPTPAWSTWTHVVDAMARELPGQPGWFTIHQGLSTLVPAADGGVFAHGWSPTRMVEGQPQSPRLWSLKFDGQGTSLWTNPLGAGRFSEAYGMDNVAGAAPSATGGSFLHGIKVLSETESSIRGTPALIRLNQDRAEEIVLPGFRSAVPPLPQGDGGCLWSGISVDPSPTRLDKVLFVRTDASHTIRWTCTLPLAQTRNANLLQVTEGPNHTWWGLTVEFSQPGFLTYHVLNVDAEGQGRVVHTHDIPYDQDLVYSWPLNSGFLLPLKDGGYLLASACLDRSSGSSALWVGRQDATGQPLWSTGGQEGRILRGKGQLSLAGFAILPNDALVVTGRDFLSLKNQDFTPYVLAMDASGRVLWTVDRVPNGPSGPMRPAGMAFRRGLAVDKEGNTYLAGYTGVGKAWILKLDPQGRSLWNQGLDLGCTLDSGAIYDTCEALTLTSSGAVVLCMASSKSPKIAYWVTQLDPEGRSDLRPLQAFFR